MSATATNKQNAPTKMIRLVIVSSSYLIIKASTYHTVHCCNCTPVAFKSYALVATTFTTVLKRLIGFVNVCGVILIVDTNLLEFGHKNTSLSVECVHIF